MKNTILAIILLLLSGFSFSQKNDSIPERKLQGIFGCECREDIVTRKAGNKFQYECILNKRELSLTCNKKGKIKWKINLKDKVAGKDLTYLCIIYGRGDKPYEEIIVTTEGKIMLLLNVRNGKEIK